MRLHTGRGLAALAVLGCLILGACGVAGGVHRVDASHTTRAAKVTLPPITAVPDYQLGGSYTPAPSVTVVARDSTARPAAGVYNVCYVNGFQTQPQEADEWLRKRPELVLRDAEGDPVADEDWPDEMLLDTRTVASRQGIVRALRPALDRCADRGFDAIEFDNLDSWTRSDGALTAANNLSLAKGLVAAAHELGLAAAQKNAAELASRAHRVAGYDFAITEECDRYEECAEYAHVYGDHVIDIEYTDDLRTKWSSVCAVPSRPPLIVLRDRELVRSNQPDYVFEHC
jgi:hypothetical protein